MYVNMYIYICTYINPGPCARCASRFGVRPRQRAVHALLARVLLLVRTPNPKPQSPIQVPTMHAAELPLPEGGPRTRPSLSLSLYICMIYI